MKNVFRTKIQLSEMNLRKSLKIIIFTKPNFFCEEAKMCSNAILFKHWLQFRSNK